MAHGYLYLIGFLAAWAVALGYEGQFARTAAPARVVAMP